MFLDSLHEVNQLVQDQLASARINVSYIEPHTEMLTPMDFVRPDYSTISIKVPAHRFDVAVGYYSECKTPSDCANRIVQFILDAANEFTKPRVHMSRAYLNYSPLADVDNRRALSFEIAIWEYDGTEARWMEQPPHGPSKTRTIGFANTEEIEIATQTHQLLKTRPFEITLWTENIVRDIGFLSASGEGASASQYMIKLEQELLTGARAAAEALNKMQRSAVVHDVVQALFRKQQYAEAAQIVALNLKRSVEVHTDGLTYLLIEDRLYKAEQVFALVEGLETPCLNPYDLGEQPEDDFWKWRETTEEGKAKAQALGVSIDLPGTLP